MAPDAFYLDTTADAGKLPLKLCDYVMKGGKDVF